MFHSAPPERIPIPVPDRTTEPFWQGLRERQLLIQWCQDCTMFVWLPKERCPKCWSLDLTWTPLSGEGVIDSFTVVRRAVFPGWSNSLPYVVVVVTMTESPPLRLTANLYGIEPDDVKTGLRVSADFYPTTSDISLLGFRIAS